jgi:hypothetical protein
METSIDAHVTALESTIGAVQLQIQTVTAELNKQQVFIATLQQAIQSLKQ